MASWTDKTPNFAPYVQQLPVDAMIQVGMQKQAQYNTGIQKIQANIDNIAGLDIIKDGHKQYLQSKLDQLGNTLKTVAAGDFSNFQLVNSIGGMTNQIARDPIIQNAVYSTQVIKKGQNEMEAARKAGKSSVQNEEWWNNQISEWQNDGDLKKKFTGSYTPYTDIDKKLRDIADKIKESDNSVDIPFKRDDAGNVITGKDGKPIVDDVMLRITTKGRPAEKILANFYDSLNENDQRQLQIDSWYHYRGATKDTFKNDLIANYNNSKKITEDAILNLNVELQTNPKLSSSQRGDIQAKIQSLNSVLNNGSLESELRKQLSDIDNSQNLDTYKYKIYTQKYLTNLAKDMSNESYKQEILSNPYAQMDMEKRRLQFSYDNMKREQDNWERRFMFDVKKWEEEQKDKQRDRDDEEPSSPTTPLPIPKSKRPTLGKLKESIDSMQTQINELDAQYAPLISDPTINTIEKKKEYLNRLVSAYSINPASLKGVGNNMIDYVRKRRELDNEAAIKSNLYISAQEASKKFDTDLDQMFTSEKGVITPDGKKISPKDLFEVANNFNNRLQDITITPLAPRGAGQIPPSKIDEKEFLEQYRGTNKEFIANAFLKYYKGLPLTTSETMGINISSELNRKYAKTAKEIVGKKLDAQSDYLAKYMPNIQNVMGGLDPQNKSDMRQVDYLLEQKLEQYRTYGPLDAENKKDFLPKKIADFKKDPNLLYTIRRNDDGTGDLVLSSKGETQIVPMTASELPKFFPKVVQRSSFDTMKRIINSTNKRTTNMKGGSNPANGVNAYIGAYSNFTPFLNNTKYESSVRFDIKGAASNNGGDNDGYEVVMYVNDDGVWKMGTITDEGFINEASVLRVLSLVDSSTVEEFLKRNK